ncbi:energy-coupling factor ABC transporter permease [Ottowia testudinis]|uniref:Energy-coupling factor ABC transporter permease n=1 Tax=Ottowia testudinis TaxID=2816950 RepID=A0A975CJP2_9BURK|nr:energy-coupling factor ABC transporter permease [Ottowia testudinis]QTD46839.1 energy-coupling factor ABC transporter permease [Ottowia testudinis]
MHIEIGILSQPKLLLAATAATALVSAHLLPVFKKPAQAPAVLLRTLLAAFFFSLLMQLWHLSVGPSELHLVGAMPIYLLFGFLPTLFGFGIGLLLQALVFEPQDLVHLAVNFLSLAVPLLAVHHLLGKRLQRLTVANVLKLDAVYYAGVTLMVGFWLSISAAPAALEGWATFAASYLLLVLIEPVLTIALVIGGRRLQTSRWMTLALDEAWLSRSRLQA